MEALQLQLEAENNITNSWKEALSDKLAAFCRIAKNYNQALSEANQYLTGHCSELHGYTEMPCIVNEWLAGICEQANSEAENISNLKITTDHLPPSLKDFDFPKASTFFSPDPKMSDGITFSAASDEMLTGWIIDNFDFDGLEAAINKAKREIQGLGLQKCAESLASSFNLVRRSSYSESEIQIKQQKGRYLLEVSHYGNWVHDRVNSLNAIRANALTFEREADVVGFSYCIQMLINEEEALPRTYDMWVDSRTKVSEDGTVSATFFKDKIKFAFEPEVFEALISFVNEYKKGDTELKELVVG